MSKEFGQYHSPAELAQHDWQVASAIAAAPEAAPHVLTARAQALVPALGQTAAFGIEDFVRSLTGTPPIESATRNLAGQYAVHLEYALAA